MRKVLLGFLVIIVLIVIFLLASPVYYGKQAQFFIDKAVSSTNQNYGKYGVQASVKSYQRGWYSSTAIIDVAVDNAKAKEFYKRYLNPQYDIRQPLVYKEVLTVVHGPVMYHSLGSNPLSAAHLQGYIELPVDLEQRLQLTTPIVTFDGSIAYNGVFTGEIVMPAVHYVSPQVNLQFNGLSFVGSMSPDMSHFSGDYTMQPLTLAVKNVNEGATMQMMLSLVNASFDFQRTPLGLWVGGSRGTIQNEKINFIVPGQSVADSVSAEYKDVVTQLNLTLTGNDYSIQAKESFGSYRMFNYVVNNIKVNVEVSNLSATIARDLQDLILQYLSVGDLSSDQEVVGQALELLPKLITPKTTIKIDDISLHLPQGPVAMKGEVNWPGYEAGMPLVTMAMMTHASLHISAGKTLVDQAIARANHYAQQQAAPAMPTMEPGPVIPARPAAGANPATPTAKPVVAAPADQEDGVSDASGNDSSSYLKDLAQAGGLFQFCLAQGYIAQENDVYTTTINYSAGQLTANGKQVRM